MFSYRRVLLPLKNYRVFKGALHYYMRLSTIKTCFFILVRVFIHSQLEAWLSGLRHRFAKSAYIVYVPWVQIPLLPRITLYAEDLISPKDISYRMLVLSHLLVALQSVVTPLGAFAPLGALQCANKHGDITQLVECLPCTQEVIGSSPFISKSSSPNGFLGL